MKKLLRMIQSLHIKILAYFSGRQADEILAELYEIKKELIEQENFKNEENTDTDNSNSDDRLC